ncbi:MAG: hypothetical protein ABIG39_05535, partial [Candidatus Micrarchaeota archaeon]
IGYNPATVQFSAASCAPICGPCDGICEDASCFTIDPDCDSTGNTTSGNTCPSGTCCAGTCTETCSTNSDCDDSNACTTDTCTGGTGCDSSCQHTQIAACIDDDGCCPAGCTEETDTDCICAATCHGDVPGKACQEYECILGECTAVLKPDCCGNNMCEPPEETTITCPSDCLFTCGNNICDEDEDECNCPQDCGPCSGQCDKCTYERCMPDGCICVGISNCCGNRICEFGETFANCPDDCLPELLVVKLISPDFGEAYARGSSISIKASVSADSRPIPNAVVTASSVFHATTLYDDGLHEDGFSGDGTYGGTLSIGAWVPYGPQILGVEASIKDSEGETSSMIFIMGKMKMSMELDRDDIYLGETLSGHGIIGDQEGNYTLSLEVTSESGAPIHSGMQDVDRAFTFTYHTSFLDPADRWSVEATGTDEANNTYGVRREVIVREPVAEEFLDVQYISPEPAAYLEGQEVRITINITRFGQPVTGAMAKTYDPRHRVIVLEEIGNGLYGGAYMVALDDPIGLWDVQTRAYKVIDDTLYGGSVSTVVGITEIPIQLDVEEPSEYQYSIGDDIYSRIRATYGDNEPADNIVVFLRIGNNTFNTRQTEIGTYETTFNIGPDISGEIPLLVIAKDPYGNIGLKQVPLQITGYSLNHYLEKYWLVALVPAILFTWAATRYLMRFRRNRQISRLLKQKPEITKGQAEVQKQYFKDHKMDKLTFNKLSQSHEEQLRELEKELGELEY